MFYKNKIQIAFLQITGLLHHPINEDGQEREKGQKITPIS